jgi:hypothetical protein
MSTLQREVQGLIIRLGLSLALLALAVALSSRFG